MGNLKWTNDADLNLIINEEQMIAESKEILDSMGDNKSPKSAYEKYLEAMNNLSPKELILASFNQSAGKYWGTVHKADILETRKTEGGTQYYVIVASVSKNGIKSKLIQEWFIGKNGAVKPTNNKIAVEDDYADELSVMISEPF